MLHWPSDPMRRVGWALVAMGITLIMLSPIYAAFESRRLYRVWADEHEPLGYTVPELDRQLRQAEMKLRMMREGVRPAWTVASPWPCAGLGAAGAAFGMLLLAIRRPARDYGAGIGETSR